VEEVAVEVLSTAQNVEELSLELMSIMKEGTFTMGALHVLSATDLSIMSPFTL
jgi:hypothetical protein